tara:strand:- start:8945 stop:9541 length:597 start_codon:yes stop_codon:yes gene_type:complete
MPYLKKDLINVGFYNKFINKLRSEYLSELVSRAKNLFRDEEGVLYSFEDITTSLGIEDVIFRDNSDYSELRMMLHRAEIEGITEYTDFRDLIQKESCSIQTDVIKENVKDKTSDNLIDRTVSELLQTEIANPLPEELRNGDTVTSDNPNDNRKWLIDGNQKRPFPDLQSFYAIGAEWRNVKTRNIDVIDSIPEGEPVD